MQEITQYSHYSHSIPETRSDKAHCRRDEWIYSRKIATNGKVIGYGAEKEMHGALLDEENGLAPEWFLKINMGCFF